MRRVWLALMTAATSATTAQCVYSSETCAEAIARDAWPQAMGLCADEYKHDPTPERAIRLGRASLNTRDYATCERVVAPLVDGPRGGDAHTLLGLVAQRKGDTAVAREHLELAFALHDRSGQFEWLSRDAHALARFASEAGEYTAALDLLARAADAAERAGERRLSYYAEIARAKILRMGGDLEAAEWALRAALAWAPMPRERAWALFALGYVYTESERDALAERPLHEALELATGLGLGDVASAARLNLGWLARRAGRFDEAEQAFATDDGDDDPVAVSYNRGLIAADRGDLEGAAAHLDAAQKAGPKGDWPWAVAYQAGVIAERRGRLGEAETHYRRSIEALETTRNHAGPLAAHVIAAHRLPHERLIGLFAPAGRFRDALSVVLSLDLSMVLATDAPPHELSFEGTATRPFGAPLTHLQPHWLDVELGGKGSHEPADIDRVLEAWRGRRLVVLAPGGDRRDLSLGRLWRLEVNDGEVRGFDVGPLDKLEQLASRLEAEPEDRATAEALGRVMVPVVPTGEPLDVLALGPIARAPLGALRREGQLVATTTPLARVLGLRSRHPATAGGRGAVVLGDPLGNLPSAASEASFIAQNLGTSALLGPEADRSAIASARGAALLHIAAHSVEDAEGATLHLADGGLGAKQIAALGPAARLVVLANCASAASRDGSGWGSLAAAFLGAGAETVIATQWSIPDGDSARLVEALYDFDLGTDVMRDPATALASAQARVAGSISPRAWAAFTVLRAPPASPITE